MIRINGHLYDAEPVGRSVWRVTNNSTGEKKWLKHVVWEKSNTYYLDNVKVEVTGVLRRFESK